MPFSDQAGLTAAQWTQIYEDLFKAAVADFSSSYVCKRVELPTGNIVRSIMEELNSAAVVLADLTGSNPNVYYELGVRHTLTPGTILVTQDSPEELPFDLKNYNVIQYAWRSPDDVSAFKKRVSEALLHLEQNPGRPDGPPLDFIPARPATQTRGAAINIDGLLSTAIPVFEDSFSIGSSREFAFRAAHLVGQTFTLGNPSIAMEQGELILGSSGEHIEASPRGVYVADGLVEMVGSFVDYGDDPSNWFGIVLRQFAFGTRGGYLVYVRSQGGIELLAFNESSARVLGRVRLAKLEDVIRLRVAIKTASWSLRV